MSSALHTLCHGKGPNSLKGEQCDCQVSQQDLKEALQNPELKDAYIKDNRCIQCGHYVPSHPGKSHSS
jgi:hypothetical protein